MEHHARPALGLAVSTIGRPALRRMLDSAAASTSPPAAVAIADQSGGLLGEDLSGYPFPVVVLRSSGGVSRGRNEAAARLWHDVDVIAFPNDDTVYPPTTLDAAAAPFALDDQLAAVSCSLLDVDAPRFRLPPPGRALNRRTVWTAVEPATFFSAEWLRTIGGFRPDIGSGAGTPWGSGEGTDLLLRMMERGARVVSRRDIVVLGPGERRDLSPERLVEKHRAYARGTGYVYRVHQYPAYARLRTLAGPLVRVARHDPSPRQSVRLARARFLGRLEGLRGRPFGTVVGWHPAPAEEATRPRHAGRLAAVVPTVGRRDALLASLRAFEACATAGVPLQVVVVAQGPLDLDPAEFPGLDVVVHHDEGSGASRARNLGLARVAPDVTHVLWPNDHTEYVAEALQSVLEHVDADVVVGRLVENGVPRYDLPAPGTPLDRRSVWAAIEPATAISVEALRRVGGWDEGLGTGASTPWQSSALADLLLRLVSSDGSRLRVAWAPGFSCTGGGFVRGAPPHALSQKARTYGRGYGYVLRTWRYPVWKLGGSVLKPLLQPGFAVGSDLLPYGARAQLALGRLEGAAGRLLPTSRPQLRRTDDLRY